MNAQEFAKTALPPALATPVSRDGALLAPERVGNLPILTEVVNTSGLRPLGRAVLLRPYKVEKMSVGGIIIPESVREKDQLAEQKAIVVEVGPRCWPGDVPWAQVGDHIIFSRWAGYQALGPGDGETYRVVNDEDIFMQITKEN